MVLFFSRRLPRTVCGRVSKGTKNALPEYQVYARDIMATHKLTSLTVFTLALYTVCAYGSDDSDSTSVQDTSLFWECPDHGFTYDAEGFTGSLAVVLDSSGLSDEYKLFLATNRIFNSIKPSIRLGVTIEADTVSVGFSGATSGRQSQVTMSAVGRQTCNASFSVGAASFYLRVFDDNNLYFVSVTSDSVSLKKVKEAYVCIGSIVLKVDRLGRLIRNR